MSSSVTHEARIQWQGGGSGPCQHCGVESDRLARITGTDIRPLRVCPDCAQLFKIGETPMVNWVIARGRR